MFCWVPMLTCKAQKHLFDQTHKCKAYLTAAKINGTTPFWTPKNINLSMNNNYIGNVWLSKKH